MASWEAYDHSRSRRYDDDDRKKRRARNDSTLDPVYYDSKHERYLYPSLPSRSHSRAPKSRDHSRAARRWPPMPFVEDEKDSLRRELNPGPPDRDHIPSRGTIDQDPILIDVPQDRRFVWVPTAGKPFETHPTPPTSDDERARRRDRRKGPRLETVGLPEMRREASPYAWSKPAPSSQNPVRISGDLFPSPESITPPTAANAVTPEKHPSTNAPNQDWSDTNRRDFRHTTPPRMNSHQVYEGLGTAEAVRDIDESIPHRTSTRYSWTKPDQAQPLSVHSSPPTPLNAPTSVPESSRRRPGSSGGSPSDYLRKPAPPQVTTLQQSERPAFFRQSSEQIKNSRNSPPPSRTVSSDKLKDGLPTSTPVSRPASRGGSTQSSPQPSPRIQHTPEYPWGSASAIPTPARRPQPPSRLAELSMPKSPRPSPSISTPDQVSPLPYPVDDRPYQTMPSERDHQYFPEQPRDLFPPLLDPVPRTSNPKRPPLSTRVSTTEPRPASAGATRSNRSSSDYSSNAKQPQPDMLPVCSRRKYTTKYKDWYTLEGCPGFDICPSCLRDVFERTPYRGFFKPSPPRASNAPSRCEFSNPWVRIGWLLTRNSRLPTLTLLMSVFTVDQTEEPCPGIQKGVRSWYSIRDRDGHFLRGFTVCPSDVRKLDILFPGFKGLFVPLPTRMSSNDDFESLNRYCSLRPQHNNRFSIYIDCLAELHETGTSAQRLPDPYNFVTLVRRKTRFAECPRDDKVDRADWYYIPSLAPALTVCEECYNDVVVPWLKSNSDVAMRFNRTPQPVRGEDKYGLSCQLYSRRMRDVFERAVDENDMRYLARKAKDRKQIEDDFQQRCLSLRRESERLKGRSGYAISSKAQQELNELQSEMEAIGEVWEDWE